jgi:putative SOS response-associated peptidase YedK
MCGRFVSPEEAAIERAFHLGRRDDPNPFARRFNVFPTDTIAFLRLPSNAEELGLAAGRWGFVPPETAHGDWLDRRLTDPRKVKAIADARVPPEEFTHWKVRLLVNDTGLDGPELIESAD